ncbi:ATP synthase-coupling factor 6, mitochondrial-like [Chrysoperla carnea]|uniref:ATP synthase-coupling factor 6, mitochondrial-like n=1 Tax=Chrysoperla carnea TaxID=189513 RepID=UPI001D078A70|nr:ATP synthase-coupling factor 6, mitochondrial-like [Chrysoperla carnea]
MLVSQIITSASKRFPRVICSRNIGVMAPMFKQASDPIQSLFIEKIKEYRAKSGGGAKLVDPNPEIERELKAEMDKVAKMYGGGAGADLTKFPTFNFTEPKVDPIVEK